KEIIEIVRVFEPQTISDLGNAPVAVQQEGPGLFDDPVGDMFSGSLSGNFFYGPVEMIDMHRQAVGKIDGAPELQRMLMRIDGELAFEQLKKELGDPGVGIDMLPVVVYGLQP